MRKKTAIFLAFALCVSLMTGCGKNEEQQQQQQQRAAADADSAEESVQTEENLRYRSQYYEVNDSRLTSALQNGAADGDDLYFTALGVIDDQTPEGVTPEWEEQYWVYGPILCRLGGDGSVERIGYIPETEAKEGEHDSILFEKLCIGQDGTIWLLEKHMLTKLPAGEETEAVEAGTETEDEAEWPGREVYYLTGIQKDGTPVSRVSLDNLDSHAQSVEQAEGSYTLQLNGIAVNGSGQICLSVSEWFVGRGNYFEDNRICVLDAKTGAVTQTIPLAGSADHLVSLPDGNVAVAFYADGAPTVGVLNEKTAAVESAWPTGDFIDLLAAGPDSGSVFYSAGDSLYRLNLEDGEISKVLGWTESDVMHNVEDSFCMFGNGRIAAVHGRETSKGIQNELAILSPDTGSTGTERETLRLAVMNLYPFTSEMVIRFNRTNPNYRIEITDYSEYDDYTSDDEADWNAGVNRLQTEIIAGNAPDLIDISLLSADRFGASGLLTDLYPLIDADPEFNRSDLNEHVLSAFEEDGKLYQTVSNYYILTTAGLSERVGDQMGWTMEDLQKAMQTLRAENPESTVFDRFITADDVLTFLLYLELEDYVDWTTGECFFDSDSFIQLLEFVGSFPESFDWEAENPTLADMDSDARILEGIQLLKQCNFNHFEDAQSNTAGLGTAKCSFVGYPTENGYGSMFAQIGDSFAITSNCKNQEAAWQFVRQFFLPVYQEQFEGFVFPTNLAVYEDMKKNAMTVEYERNPDGSFVLNEDGSRKEAERDTTTVNGRIYQYSIVSDEDVALVENVTNATTRVLGMDDSMKAIITEGAAPFFAGQRSAEEAAKLIQSKAVLYVNEQR
ncbi:MAG: extracellular solute-binding protein [Candidatus Limivicinus sp.]